MNPRDPQARRRRRRNERKDRLIQTRVAEDLEQALKREAARRRLTVSHLIRNTLEDAFHLVEDVTADVEQLVSGSVELAAAVSRDARRLASMVRGDTAEPPAGTPHEEGDAPPADARLGPDRGSQGAGGEELDEAGASDGSDDDETSGGSALDQVYGWNRIIANRAARCEQCGATVAKGDEALIGLSDEPGPRVWLCAPCGDLL